MAHFGGGGGVDVIGGVVRGFQKLLGGHF